MKFHIDTSASVLWNDPHFILDTLKGFSYFLLSLTINYYAVHYATAHAGPVVPDFFFDHSVYVNTRIVDYRFAYYSCAIMFLFSLMYPQLLLFFIKAEASLILVRDFFINLTYLGIPTAHPTVSFFTRGGDLFFSGHVALPFMAALVFWQIKPVRYILLFFTIFMSVEVLIGRQHYSIDVFAAPFIAYGVYALCQKIFKKEYTMVQEYESKLTD